MATDTRLPPAPQIGASGRKMLLWMGGLLVLLWVAAQLVELADDFMRTVTVPDPPVVALVTGATAIVSFVGVYYVTSRMRSAIAAAFVLTYLVVLTWLLVNAGFRNQLAGMGEEFLDTFTTMVATIVVFYFTAEAAVEGTKIVQASKAARAGMSSEDAKDVVEVTDAT